MTIQFVVTQSLQRGLVIAIGAMIPISTALTNLFIILALLSLVAEGQYSQRWQLLKNHPIVIATLLLFSVMVLGLLYTSVSWQEGLNLLDKYRELLYVSLFLLLFRDHHSRYWGLYAVITSVIITLLLSYLIAFGGWEIGKGTVDNPTPFKNYITQGLLMSLVGYFIIVQGLQATRNRWLITIAILLIFYNIFFMMAGRTGYLIVMCLILLGGYQIYRWRGLLIGLICTGMLGILIYMNSEVLQHRIANTFADLDRYEEGITEGSTAMRYEFVKNSLILITQHPWIGSGTGSFDHEYQTLIADQNRQLTANPHSEYLMIAVQWGFIGLILFLYLLYRLWQLSDLLPKANRWMAQGLVITMVAGCLVNSLWLDTTEGHLFAYLIGLFYSPLLSSSPCKKGL